jgi:hypothetical protein
MLEMWGGRNANGSMKVVSVELSGGLLEELSMDLSELSDIFSAGCMMKNLRSRILLMSMFYKADGLTSNGVAVPRGADEGRGRGLDTLASGQTTNRRRTTIPDQMRATRFEADPGAAVLEAFWEGARRRKIRRAALARG